MLALIGRGWFAGPGHAVQVRCDAPVVRLRLTLGVLVLIIVTNVELLEDRAEKAAVILSLVLAAGEGHGAHLSAEELSHVEPYIVAVHSR